tara:strand:+ start:1092 stop:2273 length:1182 start_codon:yes stop_codon:yes gene_type:complete
MSYSLSSLVTPVVTPPIADVHGWIADKTFPPERPLLDVAQAVPVHPPPAEVLAEVAAQMARHGLHRYTPITGLPELRAGLAAHMADSYGGEIVANDVVITAGCNQAFCATMQAMLSPGDEVLLPVPYYFNHQMWLEMLGARAVHIPFNHRAGGVPDIAEFTRAITSRTRAIVIVTPNNPTGAVYPPALLEALFELAQANHLALVIDETYKDFHPAPDTRAHGLFERPDWHDTLVQLFSFSKSYALTGYRVGSIIGGPPLVAEVTKVQDCTNICAPRVSQVTALAALTHLGPWVREQGDAMRARVTALTRQFAGSNSGFELVAAGAWFAYVQHPFAERTSKEVAREMATEHGVLCIPGATFGPSQESFVRFAFANLEAEQIPTLMARLHDAAST